MILVVVASKQAIPPPPLNRQITVRLCARKTKKQKTKKKRVPHQPARSSFTAYVHVYMKGVCFQFLAFTTCPLGCYVVLAELNTSAHFHMGFVHVCMYVCCFRVLLSWDPMTRSQGPARTSHDHKLDMVPCPGRGFFSSLLTPTTCVQAWSGQSRGSGASRQRVAIAEAE